MDAEDGRDAVFGQDSEEIGETEELELHLHQAGHRQAGRLHTGGGGVARRRPEDQTRGGIRKDAELYLRGDLSR